MARPHASIFLPTISALNCLINLLHTNWLIGSCSRSLLHTLFTLLLWIKISPSQASPISSLCIVLRRCLISSSQIAWQNSEVTANTELLQLCSSRDNPWRWRSGCYHGDKRSQHLLMSHSRTVTFLDLYSNRGVSWSVCPSAGWNRSPQGLRCKEWFRWL